MASFSVGDRVILHGLKTSGMNGKKGEVMKSLMEEEGRWAIEVDELPKKWKKIKPQNLKKEVSVGAVVIPPHGDIFYTRLPTSSYWDLVTASSKYFSSSIGVLTSNYHHRFFLPNDEIGIMTMEHCDLFAGTTRNMNLEKLGWNTTRETYMEGTVLITFSEQPPGIGTVYNEPYDLETVKFLVRELAESRIEGHPRRERILNGFYTSLPNRPRFSIGKK